MRHVIHWKRGVLQAWDGTPPDYAALQKSDWGEVSGDEAAWQADMKMLHALSQQLNERVNRADQAELSGLLDTYKGKAQQPKAIRIARVATHDIYHAGQIRYIRALQGV